MDVTDHQTALVEYANGVQLSFHSNTNVALQERRWYIAGTEGTLLADLVRNKMLIRGAFARSRPERLEWNERTDDNHNGADQAMARDLLATLADGAASGDAARSDGSGLDRDGDRPRDADEVRRRVRQMWADDTRSVS